MNDKDFPSIKDITVNGRTFDLEFDYATDIGATFCATERTSLFGGKGLTVTGRGHINKEYINLAWSDYYHIYDQILEKISEPKQ